MFFILSKVLLILIQPICWIVYLLIASAIVKKPKTKKRLFFTALGLLYFFSNGFILNTFSHWWDVMSVPPGTTKYSCAIVLGGFTSVDADGNGYFNGAANRHIAAVNLLQSGKVNKLLISGGSGLLLKGNQFKEADFVVSQLRLLKIPDSAILTENRSRNTWENAEFSKNVLAVNKIHGPYLLVTSAFHMRRALYTFKKIGLDVVPYTSDYHGRYNSIVPLQMIIPDAETLAQWGYYTKEIAGYITYYFKPHH